jgi:hypothetical protein
MTLLLMPLELLESQADTATLSLLIEMGLEQAALEPQSTLSPPSELLGEHT